MIVGYGILDPYTAREWEPLLHDSKKLHNVTTNVYVLPAVK